MTAPASATHRWTAIGPAVAAPGVLTPLSAGWWGAPAERAARRVAHELGILSRDELVPPDDPADRILRVFHGRLAARSGCIAAARERVTARGRRWRSPGAAGEARGLVREAAEQEDWWRHAVRRMPLASRREATAAYAEAEQRFEAALERQLVGALRAPAGEAVAVDVALTSALRRAGRGALTPERLVSAHGFHGEEAGELSRPVWREDPDALRRLIAQYAASTAGGRPEPVAPPQVPPAALARRACLQAIDVARAAAHRVGEELVDAGVLRTAGDVFLLTPVELYAAGPRSTALAAAAERRGRVHAEWSARELAAPSWHGSPELVHAPRSETAPRTPGERPRIGGRGAVAGVAEGFARVATGTGCPELEPGEVLVTRTAGPGWLPVITLAGALVLDPGDELGAGPAIARSLGIPCVDAAADATRTLRTGDWVRVDGVAGTVEVLASGGG